SDPTEVVDGFRNKSILVIGDLIVGRYVHSQGRTLSREAPVPVADFISEELLLGGATKLTNNLVALGAKVKVLGVVGKDEAGRWIEEELRGEGVDGWGALGKSSAHARTARVSFSCDNNCK